MVKIILSFTYSFDTYLNDFNLSMRKQTLILNNLVYKRMDFADDSLLVKCVSPYTLNADP